MFDNGRLDVPAYLARLGVSHDGPPSPDGRPSERSPTGEPWVSEEVGTRRGAAARVRRRPRI